jgi:hypothetical protein
MVRWEISEQKSGITDAMRMNILSTINTAIDTYGSSEKYKIGKDIKAWLEATYGKKWVVVIGDAGKLQVNFSYYDNKCLQIRETNLNWWIDIFQQIP